MPERTGKAASEASGTAVGAATTDRQATRTGPHRVLIALYALFTLAAGARSLVQLTTDPGRAPIAYSLSALAACTYAAGWYAISRAARGSTGLASVLLWVELSGVVLVGTLSQIKPDWFPDASVWSDYGIGYGFVPTLLPICGLIWLRWQIRHLRTGDDGGHLHVDPAPGPRHGRAAAGDADGNTSTSR
jgi:hypothetical protein